MAVDRLGNTIATGQVYALAGAVRFVDGDNVVVVVGERGEHTRLHRKRFSGRRLEECGDERWMLFERPPNHISLEIAVVDGPRIALQPVLAEAHDDRDRLGLGDRNPAEGVAESGPHPRGLVAHQRRGKPAKVGLGAGRTGDADRLVSQMRARVGEGCFKNGRCHGAEAFEGPQGSETGGHLGSRVGGECRELWHERFRIAIDDLLPGKIGDPRVLRAQKLRQVVGGGGLPDVRLHLHRDQQALRVDALLVGNADVVMDLEVAEGDGVHGVPGTARPTATGGSWPEPPRAAGVSAC